MPDIKDPMLEPVPPRRRRRSGRGAKRCCWSGIARPRCTFRAPRSTRAAGDAPRRARPGSLPTPRRQGGRDARYLLLGNGVTSGAFRRTGTGRSSRAIPARSRDPASSGELDLTQAADRLRCLVRRGYGEGARAHRRERTRSIRRRQLLGTVAQAAVGVITASRIAESSRTSARVRAIDARSHAKTRGARGRERGRRAPRRAGSRARAGRRSSPETSRSVKRARPSAPAIGRQRRAGASRRTFEVEELERTASSVCQLVDPMEARADVRAAAKNVVAADRDRKSVDYTFVPTLDLVLEPLAT